MNRKQEKYFEEELARLFRSKRSDAYDDSPMPDTVKAAQKVVDVWETQCGKDRKKRNAKLDQAYAKAKKAILFGTPSEAEAALATLEKLKL